MATTLTVNLRKKLVKIHTTRRRKQAMRYLRAEIARHSGVEEDAVKIGTDVNEYMIRNVAIHLRPVQLSLDKAGDKVTAKLSDSLKNWRKTPAQPAAPAKAEAKPGAKPAAPAAKKPEAPKAKEQKPAKEAKPKPEQKKPADKTQV